MVGIVVTASVGVPGVKQESNNSIYVAQARPFPGGSFPQHMELAYPLPLACFLGTATVTSKPLEKRATCFKVRPVLRAVAEERGRMRAGWPLSLSGQGCWSPAQRDRGHCGLPRGWLFLRKFRGPSVLPFQRSVWCSSLAL